MKKCIILAALASLLIIPSSYAIDISVRVGNATISTSGYHYGKRYYVNRARHVHRHTAHCGHYRSHYSKPKHYQPKYHQPRHYRPKYNDSGRPYYQKRHHRRYQNQYHQPKRYYRKPSGTVYYRSSSSRHDRYSVRQPVNRYGAVGVYKGKSIRYLPNGTVIEKRRHYRY